ncbi:hypothetical protein CHS0354_037303 [Potamilus streckersoni]|uniref:Uncharacterized protein n=1 Tax=Potamilus streckersoni TaxID=2493646 RepID=A0AAE0TJV6_9BIVA|nr:hypothetical protein CHS0354_037303 [Potamilus streckersoni]
MALLGNLQKAYAADNEDNLLLKIDNNQCRKCYESTYPNEFCKQNRIISTPNLLLFPTER